MLIRHAEPELDAAACLEIYAPFVTGSPVSFEDEVPELSEFQLRMRRLARTHAFLVADDHGRVGGYAYAGPHRERPAYRWTCEVSVYLHAGYHRRGLGRALYEVLFDLLQRQGYRLALAGITVTNAGSIAMHRSCGFEDVGLFKGIGWKAGAWQDVTWMARQLGPDRAETVAPPSPGPPQRLTAPIQLDP